MKKANAGLIGLAVMGQNLVMNMANHGYRVAVYNRTAAKTRAFLEETAAGKDLVPAYTVQEFVAALEKPRRILIMVKAGAPVDAVIDELLPYVEAGDVILDCGNSFFADTVRREKSLAQRGLRFMGVGVSGGEEGALKGPSIMPGGSPEAWALVGDLLRDISAKVGGDACCDYIGPDGAGHFVKTVHNGIEYGDMQLISETYWLMHELLGMDAAQMQQVFAGWNKGRLDSYLIEITTDILGRTDELTGRPLVDMILDAAGQKGTGMWTSQQALQFGVAAPTIAEAVFARCASAVKPQRVAAARAIRGETERFCGDGQALLADLEQALYAAKICSYAQGFDLLKTASHENNWALKLGDIAMLWRGGCIIRAQFLHLIKQAYDENPALENLMMAPVFRSELEKAQKAWRRVVSQAALCGVPAPCLSSALSYFDSYRSERLPANMIQAQRDYFGAHTYLRTDREGVFHTKWTEE
ncbi:MAG: NADP-dependent phosphogluconate dehydrogenase [Eubacteriales bacterium]|nr:NADP-dependent phosphogluconate dehydrogenase [Eubacteriales bacterium]